MSLVNDGSGMVMQSRFMEGTMQICDNGIIREATAEEEPTEE